MFLGCYYVWIYKKVKHGIILHTFKNYVNGLGIPSLIALHLIVLRRYCKFFFTNWWSVATLHLAKPVGAIFPKAFVHCVSVSHFGNSSDISNFFIIIVFVMVISDLWCYYFNDFDKLSYKTMNLIDKYWMWPDCSTNEALPSLLLCWGFPFPWDTTILKLGQLIAL